MNDHLATKYRPKTFKEVIGQDAAVTSIRQVLKNGSSRSFILSGPSGTGKTTLARIIANRVGATSASIIEVDAASNTGIDAMREVLKSLQFRGFAGAAKMYLIDETHRLSAQAFDSMLKSVEEPPAGVYWAFCTTEPGKIPATIRNRCVEYQLKPVPTDLVFDLLKRVAADEQLGTNEDVLYFLAQKSDGSPRRALTNLAKCSQAVDRKSAAEMMSDVTEDGEAFQLAQMLAKGQHDWAKLMTMCERLKDTNAESIRLIVIDYFTKVVMGAKDENTAQKALAVLDAFSRPYPQGNKIYPVILSLGELIYAPR